jgi:hypothetical protein
MLMFSILQSKDTGWQPFVAYKKMYLPVKDKHRLKIKGYKIFFQAKGA